MLPHFAARELPQLATKPSAPAANTVPSRSLRTPGFARTLNAPPPPRCALAWAPAQAVLSSTGPCDPGQGTFSTRVSNLRRTGSVSLVARMREIPS